MHPRHIMRHSPHRHRTALPFSLSGPAPAAPPLLLLLLSLRCPHPPARRALHVGAKEQSYQYGGVRDRRQDSYQYGRGGKFASIWACMDGEILDMGGRGCPKKDSRQIWGARMGNTRIVSIQYGSPCQHQECMLSQAGAKTNDYISRYACAKSRTADI